MLLDQNARVKIKGYDERVFPQDIWGAQFESRLPDASVFANSVLDAGINIGGELGAATFAAASWGNWVDSMRIAVSEISTRVGIPPLFNELGGVAGNVYQAINSASMRDVLFEDMDAADLIPQLMKDLGSQAISAITGTLNAVGAVPVVGWVIEAVVGIGLWVGDLVSDFKADELGKNAELPPLQTEDPSTDSWQVNVVLQFLRKQLGDGAEVQRPDGTFQLASDANYTRLFSPAFRSNYPWTFAWRKSGVVMQQGTAESGGSTGVPFAASGALGYMPGTGVVLRILQASFANYYSLKNGVTPDRYNIRCHAYDKACGMSEDAFDGSVNCKQCVKAESVWPQEGVAWAMSGVPLNSTTPGSNTGQFYPSTNTLLQTILDMVTVPGPLLFTVDAEQCLGEWSDVFEAFWDFAQNIWQKKYGGWDGVGWRGQLSRIATQMTAMDTDYRGAIPGGRYFDMPFELVANPRDGEFKVPFEQSIYKRIIEPWMREFIEFQTAYVNTAHVAYVAPGSGALYSSSDPSKIKNNALGQLFQQRRAQLLSSPARMMLDLRRVLDPEYRALLEASGVKPSKLNPVLGPIPTNFYATDLKPSRAVPRPQPPLAVPMPGLLLDPGIQSTPKKPQHDDTWKLVTIGTLGVAAAGATYLWMKKPSKKKRK